MAATWKKHINRLLCMALLGLVLLSLIAPGVHARLEQPCSLTIDYIQEDAPISGVSFRLYRMAEVNNRYEPVCTGVFADVQLDTDNLEEQVLDLYALVEKHGVEAEHTLTTDENGQAVLTGILPGVFLLVGEPATVEGNTYHVDKQIVSLPVQQEGQWVDTLTLRPKSTKLPVQKLIDITAVKRWDDRGYESQRPQAIGVSLLRDGKTVSTVVLNQANNWTYTWNDLLPNAKWSVSEDVPEGYSLTVEREGNSFILTNHRKTIPQTGQIWWPVIAALGLGLVLILLGTSLVRGKGRNA